MKKLNRLHVALIATAVLFIINLICGGCIPIWICLAPIVGLVVAAMILAFFK